MSLHAQTKNQSLYRIVIASPQGRSGKTIISIGLCASFAGRGLAVQPFKAGPDYIDPSWLTAAAGRECRNLDTIMVPPPGLASSFARACRDADIAIIEGAMGLYDGLHLDGRGSTAHISKLLDCPVIMTVNASRMTNSVAAMLAGYQHFQPDVNIAGVILNQVSGKRHDAKLRAAIERYCGIPVVGSVRRDPGLTIAERHLGITPAAETDDAKVIIERIGKSLEEQLDLEAILKIARSARPCSASMESIPVIQKEPIVKLGVIRDRVFHFYYPENLEALARAGAALVYIDSLRDRSLPDVDGLYIGGGFPELFLPELEANQTLRSDIAQAIEDNLPVYAECAGLMYLSRSIRWQDRVYEMVGAFPADTELCPSPQGHGYVRVESTGENPLFPAGFTFWGHEFHHSRLSALDGSLKFGYRVRRGHGIDGARDGLIYRNAFGAYTHIHASAVPEWAEALVSRARQAQSSRRSCSVMNNKC